MKRTRAKVICYISLFSATGLYAWFIYAKFLVEIEGRWIYSRETIGFVGLSIFILLAYDLALMLRHSKYGKKTASKHVLRVILYTFLLTPVFLGPEGALTPLFVAISLPVLCGEIRWVPYILINSLATGGGLITAIYAVGTSMIMHQMMRIQTQKKGA